MANANELKNPSGQAKLICGCGYIGERVARRWLAQGDEVWATTRSQSRGSKLAQMGIRPIVVDISNPFAFPNHLPPFHTVLFAVGFDRTTGQSIQDLYVNGLRHLLEAVDDFQRLIYISSTGVYGQVDHEWVDEQSPCRPSSPGGQACLAAEQLLAGHPLGMRRIILRLAGIYGPGRIPKLDAIQNGEPIESLESGFLNLIYVEDAVTAILTAEKLVTPPDLFLIADGQPALRSDFYRELARLLNAPAPRFTAPRPGSSTSARSNSDKRVCNDRMKELLPFALECPSYREGLAAIVANVRQRQGQADQ